MSNDLTLRLAKAVLEEYHVRPDYFMEHYCRFCGGSAKQQKKPKMEGMPTEHYLVWQHELDCVVPPAEDYARNNT